MRQVKRWRYYCDYCRKAGGSKGHIIAHEKGCTKNPNRECGLCRFGEQEQVPLPELIAFVEQRALLIPDDDYFYPHNGKHTEALVNELQAKANNCPACTLAALRQSKKQVFLNAGFNVKERWAKWWADHPQEPRYYY